jgi:hypothetical protein
MTFEELAKKLIPDEEVVRRLLDDCQWTVEWEEDALIPRYYTNRDFGDETDAGG